MMAAGYRLPRLLLIADRFTRPDVASRVLQAVRAGVPWIQLRDHEADPTTFDRAADEILYEVSGLSNPPLISVNSRIESADTRRTAFHTGIHGPSIAHSVCRLGNKAVIGYSAHSAAEAVRARDDGAAYVIFSPVYPTKSKPGHPGHGIEELKRVVNATKPCPVFALGGLTTARVPDCLEAGAYGAAVVRGILDAEDIERAVRVYSDCLSQGPSTAVDAS